MRGDVSRTTEGSGLGLSIARSLTLLQEGNFEIHIDGDLFKVVLKFKIVSESDEDDESNESDKSGEYDE